MVVPVPARDGAVVDADGRVEERPVTGHDVVEAPASLDVDLDDEEAAARQAWWSTQDHDR